MSGSSHSPLEAVVLTDVTPTSVDDAEIRAALDSSRPLVRQRGARVCATLAEDDPESVRPLVDDLGAALCDDNPGVAQTAASALQEVASADPAAVVGVVDQAATLAESDLGGLRVAGAQLLVTIARERPADCRPAVEPLLDSLGRPPRDAADESLAACVDDSVTQRTIADHEQEEQRYETLARQLFANVLVSVADARPESMVSHVEAVAVLTDDEDPVVCGAALDGLAAVARERPAAVRPVAGSVLGCLDAEAPTLRARAIRTLGFLENDRYVDQLRTVAETDSDEEIATFAAETAAFLEQ